MSSSCCLLQWHLVASKAAHRPRPSPTGLCCLSPAHLHHALLSGSASASSGM